MTDNLAVMFGLARKTKRRVFLFSDLRVRHHLDFLHGFWNLESLHLWLRYLAVHQSRFLMKLVKQRIFNSGYVRFVFDWICPHPSDFPNVDLAICDNVASSRCQMAVHARAYAIDGLTNIDRDLIKIAEHVAANLVCEGANGPASEGEINCHALFRGDQFLARAGVEQRL